MKTPDNIILAALWMLGGLGLFLYGIDIMGNALRHAAGGRIRAVFDTASRSRLRGLFAGAVVTALIQSSSATTVMVVGFINAGLLTLKQSLGIILGANIGSTITPQITAFKLDEITLPVLGIGFVIHIISRRRSTRQAGLAVMGFGMLFFGLSLMKLAVSGYDETIRIWLTNASSTGAAGHITAFLVSLAATAIIQSSAATVAMIQVLAFKGVLTDIEVAIPLILGTHIGTCVTALLASLQSGISARRSALAHLIFNIAGAIITIILFPVYSYLVPLTSASLPHQIANAHLMIKVFNTVLFLPILGAFSNLLTRILPGSDKLSAGPEFLDFHCINQPDKALQLARKEIQRMYQASLLLLEDSVSAFLNNSEPGQEDVIQREDRLDDLYRSVCEFLVAVSQSKLDTKTAAHPSLLLHVASDIERIGDHAENIAELPRMTGKDRPPFSQEALTDIAELNQYIKELSGHVEEMFSDSIKPDIQLMLSNKQKLNDCADRCLSKHAERLSEGSCNAIGGILFVELVINLRRVANHLRNIAVSLSGEMPEQSSLINHIRQEIANKEF